MWLGLCLPVCLGLVIFAVVGFVGLVFGVLVGLCWWLSFLLWYYVSKLCFDCLFGFWWIEMLCWISNLLGLYFLIFVCL